MKTFTYTAVKSNGEVYKRTVEASDRFEIYDVVRKEGGTIREIRDASRLSFRSVWRTIDTFLQTVKEAEKIILARNLSTMVKAGLPISRALSVMERQTKNKKLKSILTSIGNDITGGTSFNAALAKFPKTFSPLFVSMVRAGEESGKLSESLLVIARQMEEVYKLKKKVKGALIYPSIIVIAMLGIGVLMLVYVVPTLSQTFDELGAELPLSTRTIISASDFLVNNALISLLGFVALFGSIMAASRTPKGKRIIDFIILHIPIISELVKETNSARTTRTLSSLLSAGVEVVSAISITRDVIQNSYYKEALVSAKDNVEKGKSIAEVFIKRSDIYPVMVGDMMAVGEETGQLSNMLDEIATFFEEDVSQRTKDLSTIIEPFLMIIIGTVVGFFAISMISPIYSISENI